MLCPHGIIYPGRRIGAEPQIHKGLKGKYWALFPTISVGEILRRMGDVYPVVSASPIGESLMQATLSAQESADFLFYLMSAMSTLSASTTTASTGTTCCCIARGLILDMGPEQLDALEKRYRDFHFKGKTTREWSTGEYEAKIAELKGKLSMLT